MPTLFSAADIAEQALRQIGRVPVHEDPRAEDMEQALKRFEVVINSSAGDGSIVSFWTNIEIPIVASDRDYSISEYQPDNGMQFVYSAYLKENDGNSRTPLTIVNQKTFNSWDSDVTGIPKQVFIDRTNNPTLYVDQILGDDVEDGSYTIILQIQTFGVEIKSGGDGSEVLNIRPTAYLWAIHKLAYFLGNGLIRRLPDNELSFLKTEYMSLEATLQFDNKELDDVPLIEPWGQ